MNVLYGNYVDAGTINVLSTIPGFEATNIQDTRLSRFYKSTGAAEEIVVDLGVARAVSGVSIVRHNFTSGVSITLQAHTSNTWAAPSFQHTLDYSEYMIFDSFLVKTYRWWRLVIIDIGHPDSIEVGRWELGPVADLPYIEPTADLPKTSTSQYGFSRSHQVYINQGVRFRSFRVSFPYVEQVEKELFEAVWAVSEGIPVSIDFPELPVQTGISSSIYGLFSPGELALTHNMKNRLFALSVEIQEVF